MIKEYVHCDICGVEIRKIDKADWHSLNIVRNAPITPSKIEKLTASFHVCTEHLNELLFVKIGSGVNDEHIKLLRDKIQVRLKL